MFRLRQALRIVVAYGCAALLTAAQAAERKLQVENCEALRGLQLGTATVRSSEWFAGGNYRTAGGAAIAKLPPFCRALLTASPSPVSNITVEIWLPSEEVWNGKLLGTGNGGFAGSIETNALAGAVKQGYVGANTDMGTFPASIVPNGYDAGTGRPEMVKDWGFRSTHEMTVAAKSLIRSYYKRSQTRSYFVGCSTGGHQGLSEAQRYPEDYDGIIAGAAGHNRTHLHATFLRHFQITQKLSPLFAGMKTDLVIKAVRQACAGKDGGAPGDEYLNNPAACGFEPKQLACSAGKESDTCLSALEVEALEAIYDGVRNPRTKELIYPGWAKGAEAPFLFGLSRSPAATKTGPGDGLFRWVFGPQWDARTFDFDRDMSVADAQLGPIVNSIDADLSAFAKRGGKLIMFHGWADMIVSPYDSIVYFDRINGVEKAAGASALVKTPSAFSRLFMVPGLGHCGGGAGATEFGQNSIANRSPMLDVQPDPNRNILSALDRWVESDVAPERLLAVKSGTAGAQLIERPICSYPKAALYDGKGDPKLASSYACAEAPIGNIEFPGLKYTRPQSRQIR